MSFREKSAWITLVTVLAAGSVFFTAVFTGQMAHGMSGLHYTLISLLILVLGQVVLRVIAWQITPRDERAARDERELMIQWRANSLAYYVLLLGLLAFGVLFHLMPLTIPEVIGYLLLAIAAATVSSAIAMIVMLRRGS
jgi:predicted Na+-dependent transporter